MRSCFMAVMRRMGTVLLLVCVCGAAHAAPFAYISSSEDHTVSVIDLATDTVVNTIQVAGIPLGIAVSHDGSRVFVSSRSRSKNLITVIDGRNQAVLTSKSVDIDPVSVAVNTAQTRIYVVGRDPDWSVHRQNEDDRVMVFDAHTLEVVAKIPLVGYTDAGYVAVSPDDTYIWVQVSDNGFAVIDAGSNTLSRVINVQAHASSPIVFGANPRIAYVGGRGDLITVDISSKQPRFENIHMMVSRETEGLALNAAGDKAYVAQDRVGLEIYSLTNGKRLASVKTGKYPGAVAVHPDGSRIYVINSTENTVEVVDAQTFTVLSNIPVGKRPIVFGQFIQPTAVHGLNWMVVAKLIVLSLLGAWLLFIAFRYFRSF